MRISRISIKGLFGIFTHEIGLKSDERITIIHGPNGVGKTVILTMINSFFCGRYGIFQSIPFEEFSIAFDDGRILNLKKIPRPTDPNLPPHKRQDDLILEFHTEGSKPLSYPLKPLQDIRLQMPVQMIEQVIPGLESIGPATWHYLPTQEILSIEDIVERFGDRLPIERRPKETQPEWLSEIKKGISVKFIETQRLLTYSKIRRQREFEDKPSMIPAVRTYSEELATMIQSKLAEYASLAQSLDRSFPTRLVKGSGTIHSTIDQLRNDLNSLEEKRARLEIAGLLDRDPDVDFREFLNIDANNSFVLSVYIDDVKKKLAVFDELSNKIDLLVKIINNRFLFKEMSISKKDGFVFKASNDKKVPTASLSSGEQHELVLFYELLFKVKPSSLILIDEPELSLHVGWQQQFLNDIEDITKLTGFHILIATHSPQIIHDRWDITVELKGPQNA
ncbi:MAG: excinuclease [Chlorobiaceae bacterium]|nr:excinuclease [Chlorobiaceae bacterium]